MCPGKTGATKKEDCSGFDSRDYTDAPRAIGLGGAVFLLDGE